MAKQHKMTAKRRVALKKAQAVSARKRRRRGVNWGRVGAAAATAAPFAIWGAQLYADHRFNAKVAAKYNAQDARYARQAKERVTAIRHHHRAIADIRAHVRGQRRGLQTKNWKKPLRYRNV